MSPAPPVSLSASAAFEALATGPGLLLVDIREPDEHASGTIDGAIAMPRARLEADPASVIPRLDTPVLLVCALGGRSAACRDALRARGYTAVQDIAGGMAAWRAADLPVQGAEPAAFLERYDRHLRLTGVGLSGQRRLREARVALIGAGGLGSPVALYLAAAGIGHLRLIDDDRVERSNLQRQVLHGEASLGVAKVESAYARLKDLNPDCRVEAVDGRLRAANVEALLGDADVVVDGSDNFATRYLANAACVQLGKPLVYAAVERFSGQASVFDLRRRGVSPCYRCLFPEPPGADAAPNCAEAGVLGVLPGLLGLLQATETIKLVLGIGEPLVGRLLLVDALGLRFRELVLAPDPDCPACGAGARFDGYADLERWCAAP